MVNFLWFDSTKESNLGLPTARRTF